MIIIRQKYFDEEQPQEGGSSTLGTVAKVGGGILATAGLFAGARRGMLGNTVAKGANVLWGKAGNQMKNLGNTIGEHWEAGGKWINKQGNKMVNSGAKEWSLANGLKEGSVIQQNGKFVATAGNEGKLLKDAELFKNNAASGNLSFDMAGGS